MNFGVACDKWHKRGGKVYLIIFFCSVLILVIFVTQSRENNDFTKGSDGQNDMYENDVFSPISLIPKTVHYVWCHNHTFQFQHFISVLSTWKVLKPTDIIIHTLHNIGTDNTHISWFDNLVNRIPAITVHTIPQNLSECCGVPYGVYILEKKGGIFVSENTLINQNFVQSLKENFSIGLTLKGENVSVLAAARAEIHLQEVAFLDMHSNLAHHIFENSIYCSKSDVTNVFNFKDQTPCIEMQSLHPIVTVQSNTTLGAIVRSLLYGTSKQVHARPLLPGKIPKQVHMVWFGMKNMTFSMYLSLRSILTVLNPDKVFIHGDGKLFGHYFEKITKDPRVKLLRRKVSEFNFGRNLNFTEDKRDVARYDILFEYGGIYVDWDVISVKPIDDILATGFDAVMNIGNRVKEINNGVMLAKADSHFLKYYLESYTHYGGDVWPYNDMEIRYKLFAMYPATIYFHRNLQIICSGQREECTPLWKKQNENTSSFNDFDQQIFSYFVQFTDPETPEYANETALEEGRGFVADIGQYIMSIPYEYDTILT